MGAKVSAPYLVVRGTGTWGMQDKFKFYQKNLEV